MEPLLVILFVLVTVSILMFAGVVLELLWTMPSWLVEQIRISNEYRERRMAITRAAAAIGKQMKEQMK